MIKRISYFSLLLVSLLSLARCIDPYSAPVSNENVDILVIDGFLNSTGNSASVKLSKAIPLSVNQAYKREKKATVAIEEENGAIYNLVEKDTGVYESSNMNINSLKKYQLHIRTEGGKEYRSDFIELKQSPPIDSVTWKPAIDGVTIYANTHDTSESTHYYQWTYSETWEYNSDFYSAFKIMNGTVVPRPPAESIYICWTTAASTKISINSTLRLSSDVVRDFSLTSIEKGSKKISRKYSILVQQKALTEQAYSYWQQLQKTTENLGGLFDPLPYRLLSNVYNVNDSSEPVLGYFNGGGVSEKRIFISVTDLPNYLLSAYRSPCVQDTIPVNDISKYGSATLLTSSVGEPIVTGYLTTSSSCIDCKANGGTTIKPEFWP